MEMKTRSLWLLLWSLSCRCGSAWMPSSILKQQHQQRQSYHSRPLTTAFSMRPDPMGPDSGKPPSSPQAPRPNSAGGVPTSPQQQQAMGSTPWRPQQQQPFQQPSPNQENSSTLKGPKPSVPPFLPDMNTEENNRRFLRLRQDERPGSFSPRGPSSVNFPYEQGGFPQQDGRNDDYRKESLPRGSSQTGRNDNYRKESLPRDPSLERNERNRFDSASSGSPPSPYDRRDSPTTSRPPPRGFQPDSLNKGGLPNPPPSSSTRPPFPNESSSRGGPPFPGGDGPRGPPFPNDVPPRGPPFANDASAQGPPFASNAPPSPSRRPPFANDASSRGPPFANDAPPSRGPPFANDAPPFPNNPPPFPQQPTMPGRDPSFNRNSYDSFPPRSPPGPPLTDEWRQSGTRPSSASSSSTSRSRPYGSPPPQPPPPGRNYENQPYFASPRARLPPDMYDVAVVGGGIVGVQAALTAAATSGVGRVVLIDAPSGNSGIISPRDGSDLSIGAPTGLFSKALRDASKRIQVSTLRGMGLREDSVWNEIINSCLDLAQANADDIERQLEAAGVERVRGYASFPSSGDTNTLMVRTSRSTSQQGRQDDMSTKQIRADQILLATGSQPYRPPGIPFDDGNRVLDSDSINRLSFLPRSIAITGSGIIAVEFAKIFRNLGSKVTLIIRDQVPRKALEKIGLDKDVAATLVADLVRSGIQIERGAQVGEIVVPKNPRSPLSIQLRAKGGGRRKSGLRQELQCSAYLAAVGRKPNTKSLNLQGAGIEVDEYGGILVDANLCTTAPAGNVFAAGDVLGRPFLASTGTAQGRAAVSTMFPPQQMDDPTAYPDCDPDDPSCDVDGISRAGTSFDPASLASNPFAFPTGIWTSPEAAYYGLTKDQARTRGINAGESMALYAECLRGRVFSPNGLLKLVFERATGRVVGVHICGDDACELIHYGMEVVKAGRTIQDLNNSLFSAVTFHEMYKIAAQNALDERGARKRRAAVGRALAARERSRAKRESYDY